MSGNRGAMPRRAYGDRLTACAACLERTWLLARLSGHLDQVRKRTLSLLELDDQELIRAVAGQLRPSVERQREQFDADAARAKARAVGLGLVCRHDPAFPRGLTELRAPPAVLHLAGDPDRLTALCERPAVSVVGARRASPYGLECAVSLARGIGAAGLTVISGMAAGVDSAAHEGVLAVDADTIAVLASGAELAYPASSRSLYRRIKRTGLVVSELPPGTACRRWMFPARNRVIAALGAVTVVVEARTGSGALLTAQFAHELGRPVGAVPGRVTSPQAAGPHGLLRGGATLIADPGDVLDELFGAEVRPGASRRRSPLPAQLQSLLDALAEGYDPSAASARSGFAAEQGLAALASLELSGRVRRGPGGSYHVA